MVFIDKNGTIEGGTDAFGNFITGEFGDVGICIRDSLHYKDCFGDNAWDWDSIRIVADEDEFLEFQIDEREYYKCKALAKERGLLDSMEFRRETVLDTDFKEPLEYDKFYVRIVWGDKMSIEKCNRILEDVARCSIYEETCIDVGELTNTPIVKQVFYTSSLDFVLKDDGEYVELQHCYFALLIEVDDDGATVYLENSDGEILGEIEKIL